MTLISAKSFLYVAVQRWWLVYGLSLALFFLWIAIAIWGPPTPKPTDDVVFYPWIVYQSVSNILASFILAMLGLGCLLYALKRQSLTIPLILLGITLCGWIALLAWIGPIVGTLRTGREPNPTLTHVESLTISEHIYNLATHAAFYEVRGEGYIFYECDSLGISCRAIYRYKPTSLEDVYADDENPPFISFDGANISIHIAGRLVYIHPISIDNL